MRSVLDTCTPRSEILAGSFNPEVFTASLSPVIEYYRSGRAAIDKIYTDAESFFREGTYPTQGLRQALSEIFSRIAGDMTAPAIHRLETAFGGGKTHTLIACTHIAFKGTGLKDVLHGIVDPRLLPEPGSVAVVGIAGDEIPVHRPRGEELVPYTLWGEIAYQIGGERLYQEVEADANSFAAPGKPYFEKVFNGRKVLLMLDELAQYAARLEAARPDGASQLAAFLMSLHGYARNHPGISIVLTLASAADAFAKQTAQLAKLISQVRGEQISEDEAVSLGEQAVKGVTSVVARDAVQITPVQATEISSVFAKRLFVSIDRDAAEAVAEEYMQMYRRNAGLLPDEATSESFKNRMVANYPFHPTLVDFLNKKLASAENFQGTRGVLRVLSLAVRSLWLNRQAVPMIHTCHLDLRSDRVVNEILGRTGSSDLLYVLNTDVGSVDTETLEGGFSNAELADRRNPHPEGHPLYEYTWKTVFLHSLVGREEGLNSRIFGITESEALFSVAFPGLTPPQVRVALEEIQESAFYLRFEQGRYYAGEEPTINSVLARIRRTVQANQIEELLQATARKMLSGNSRLFYIEHDVSLPEHLPDGKGKPVLGVVSLTAESIDVEAMVTTKGEHRPREQQNLIFLLVPETVSVLHGNEQQSLFNTRAQEARQRLETIARQVKAMRLLAEKPQSYGVNPKRLDDSDFRKRQSEREQALHSAVAGTYTRLYYPLSGSVIQREIKTAGGESGAPFLEQIREILIRDGKLVTEDRVTQADLVNFSRLFFEQHDTIPLETVRRNFVCSRKWPVLEDPGMLERIIRIGVQHGQWCMFRMGDGDGSKPVEFYDEDQTIPMGVDLYAPGYGLITPQGAKQRGWMEPHRAEPVQVREDVLNVLKDQGVMTIERVTDRYAETNEAWSKEEVIAAVTDLIREGRVIAYRGTPDQQDKPDLLSGHQAVLYTPQPGDVLITPAEAEKRGWLSHGSRGLTLEGREAVEKLLPLLRRLGSIYNKGAKTIIDQLDLIDLELPAGGLLRLELHQITPQDMQALGELFEILSGVVKPGHQTDVYLKVNNPDDDCPFIQELKRS